MAISFQLLAQEIETMAFSSPPLSEEMDTRNVKLIWHFQDSTTLRLMSGTYSLPKEDEEKPLGEDALFISDDEHTIGVTDRVGGWAECGIDSGVYARQLMGNASYLVENHSSIDDGFEIQEPEEKAASIMGWTKIKHLGEGGFGSVSLARSTSQSDGIGPELPPLFAVKSAPNPNSQSLKLERELLHQLRHCPAIIGCHGADASLEDDEIQYHLFLEYAAGGSLVDRIYLGKPMSEIEIMKYSRSILIGLRHMHKKGIVHCDIKPDNILLVEDSDGGYVAKICDLGLALLEEDETDGVKLRGTAAYLAPESVLHGRYGPEVDIWALGCTVAEMFLGRPLRHVNGNYELTREMVKQLAKQEVEIPAGISADAHSFLEKCLNTDTMLRWDADGLLREDPFVSGLGSGSDEYDLDPLVSDPDVEIGEDVHEYENDLGAASGLDDTYTEEELLLTMPMKLLKKRDRDEDEEDLSDDPFCKRQRLDPVTVSRRVVLCN